MAIGNESEEESDEKILVYFGLTGPIYGLVSGIILPIIILNNLIGNALIIAFSRSLTPSNHARVLYISIALADLLPTIHHFFLHIFLSDGLDFLTDGHYDLALNNISPLVCRFNWFLFGVAEQFCNWLLVLFSAERLFVVFFPFKARNFTARTSLYGVIGTFAISVTYHLTFINTHNTVPDTLHEGELECFESNDAFSLTLFTVNFIFVYFLVPGIINAISNVILLLKVKVAAESRKVMSSGLKGTREGGRGNEGSELLTTTTLVIMSFLHFLLVLPVVLTGIYTRILYVGKEAHEELLNDVVNIFSSAIAFSNISNGTSFYVYFLRVNPFRIALLSLFASKFRDSYPSNSAIAPRS